MFEIESSDGKVTSLSVVHDGKRISFRVRSIARRNFISPSTLFTPVNTLINNLTEDEKGELFSVYDNIHDLTTHKQEFHLLVTDLEDQIRKMFSILPLNGIDVWATRSYSEFSIPDVIKGTTAAVGNYPESSTYNVEEYKQLCGLSVIFKMLLPIFGEFIDDFKVIHGTPYKEYWMYRLLDIIDINSMVPIVKLTNYVTSKITDTNGNIKVPMELLMSGLGTENYVKFIISSVLIRTLGMSETDVPFVNEGVPNNIQAKVTNSLRAQIEQNIRQHDIKDTTINNAGGEVGNTGIQESIKSVQRVSDVYGKIFQHTLRDHNLYKRLGVDENIYLKFKAVVDEYNPTIDDGKLCILGLVMFNTKSVIVPVESFTLTDRISVNNALAVSAAYLHTLKLYPLVNYLLSRTDPKPTNSLNQYRVKSDKPDPELLEKAKSFYYETDDGRNPLEVWLADFVTERVCANNWLKTTPGDLHETYSISSPWYAPNAFKDAILVLIIAVNTDSSE